MLLLYAAATFVPSLFQQTSKIPPSPLYVFTSSPFCTSQISSLLSNDPDARYFPSGENATEYTGSVCLRSVCTHRPSSASHSLIVAS